MKVKINSIPMLISVGIGLLTGYGFYAANSQEYQHRLMFAFLAIEFSVFFMCGFAIKYAERGNGNITVLSIVFVILALIANIIFSILPFSPAPFIIINGILLLVYAGIVYGLSKALN